MIQKFPGDFKLNVTFDNLFMSLNLLKMLVENGIRGLWTLSSNHTDKFPSKDN